MGETDECLSNFLKFSLGPNLIDDAFSVSPLRVLECWPSNGYEEAQR